MDRSSEDNFPFFDVLWANKTTGAACKWKNGLRANGEAFWGSSRWFVLFTDFWHLSQAIFLLLMFLAIVLYSPVINWWADFLIMRLIFGAVFELFYGKVFVWRGLV